MDIDDIKQVVDGALNVVETKSAQKVDAAVEVLNAKIAEMEVKHTKETNSLRETLASQSHSSNEVVTIADLFEKTGIKSAKSEQKLMQFKANEITTSRADASGAAGALGTVTNIGAARTPGLKVRLIDHIRQMTIGGIFYEFGRAIRPAGSTTGIQSAEAAAKTLGEMQWDLVQNQFKTFAGYVPVSRQALKRIPELMGEVQWELSVDLDKTVNDYLTDTMIADADIQVVDNTDYDVTGMTLGVAYIVALRKAVTAMDAVEGNANVIVMNPADVEILELAQSDDGFFLMLPSIAAGAEPGVFKVPYVKSNQIAAGTALVADTSSLLFVKNEEMELRTSDSHSDYFSKNLVAVLLETSGSLCIKRPDQIVKVTLPVAGDLV